MLRMTRVVTRDACARAGAGVEPRKVSLKSDKGRRAQTSRHPFRLAYVLLNTYVATMEAYDKAESHTVPIQATLTIHVRKMLQLESG